MGYFNKLSEQLGEGTGKGIVWLISKTVLAVVAAIATFFAWYRPREWNPNEEKKSFLRHNTWRIAVTSVFLGIFISPNLVKFSWLSPAAEHGKVNTLVQLRSDRLVRMPFKEFFESAHGEEKQTLFDDGITYQRYKPGDGTVMHVLASNNLCQTVPAGKSIVLETATPPTDVINMELEAQVATGPTMEPQTAFEKVSWSVFGKPVLTNRSWRYIRDHWDTIDSSKYGIRATARSARNIPYPHAGGMVCF